MGDRLTTEELRDIVQDAHVSFLLGAGASAELFEPLGDVENWLTYLASQDTVSSRVLERVRASVYAYFFEGVVRPNKEVIEESPSAERVLSTYRDFLRTINTLLVRRRSSILDKQINLFTTNIDLVTEIAAEQLQIELNDGFSGRYFPLFSASNFGTVKSRRSLQYDNLAEIPTFNLYKLHGSVNWATRPVGLGEDLKDAIVFKSNTELFDVVDQELDRATPALYEIERDTNIREMLTAAEDPNEHELRLLQAFMGRYEKLAIVNPTKDKFGLTVLNQNYYDLLRNFSNTLEKENGVLFVIGFSCRDEHIRELMIRAARSNPTLLVVVFAYVAGEVRVLKDRLNADLAPNSNILVVGPEDSGDQTEDAPYSLRTVTERFFKPLLPKQPTRPDAVVDVRLRLAPELEVDSE